MAQNIISVQYRTYKGISNLNILRKSDGVLYSWPKPNTFILNDGQEQVNQMTRNDLGEMSSINNYTQSRVPLLQIGYAQLQLELFAFQTGFQLTSGTFDVGVPRQVIVPTDGLIAGATVATNAYFGMAQDGLVGDLSDVFAAINDDGISVALTPVLWTGAQPAGPNEIAFGPDGALYFSSDLVGCVVSVRNPWNVDANSISNTLVGEVSIQVAMVNSVNKVDFINIPTAIIDTAGTPFEPGADAFTINLRPIQEPGACLAYNMFETNQEVSCSS